MRFLTKERIAKSATRNTHKMEQKKLYSICVSLFFLGMCFYMLTVFLSLMDVIQLVMSHDLV